MYTFHLRLLLVNHCSTLFPPIFFHPGKGGVIAAFQKGNGKVIKSGLYRKLILFLNWLQRMVLQDLILYFSKRLLNQRIFALHEYSIWENKRKLTLNSHRVSTKTMAFRVWVRVSTWKVCFIEETPTPVHPDRPGTWWKSTPLLWNLHRITGS